MKTGSRKRNLENLPLSAFCSAHDETTQRVAWRKSTPAPGPAFRTLAWASRDRRLAGTQPPAFCGTPPPSGPTSLPLHDEAEFYRVESTSRCPCPSPLITDIRMPRAAYVLVSLSLRGGHRRLCGPEGDSARAAGAHVCAQTLAESSPRAGSSPPHPSFPRWSPSPVSVSHGVHGLSLLRRLTLYLTRCESSNLTSGPGASSVSRMASAASFAGDMCLHPLGRVPREGKSSVSSWGCSGGFPWLWEDMSLPP